MEYGRGKGKGAYEGGRGAGRGGYELGGFAGAMRRQSRRTIDHLSPGVQLMKDRVLRPEMRRRVTTIVSSEANMKELLPPSAYPLQATYASAARTPPAARRPAVSS